MYELTEPIADTTPCATERKLESIPPSFVGVAAIVSTVAGVVSNHGPTGEGPSAESDDAHEVNPQSHGEQTNGGTSIGPGNHLVEMTNVGIALLLLELVSQCLDVGSECYYVKILDPLVFLLELLGSTVSACCATHGTDGVLCEKPR